MNEEEIERKAVEELLLEAKRAKERADEHGTFGWNKPKVAAVNKRFLENTLVSTMRSEADRGDAAKRFVPRHKPSAYEWHGAKRRGSPERAAGAEKAAGDAPKSKKHKDGDASTEKPKAADKDHLRDYATNGDNISKDLDSKRESGSSTTEVKDSKHGEKTVSGATHSKEKEKSPVRAKSNSSKSYSESSRGRDRMTRERH